MHLKMRFCNLSFQVNRSAVSAYRFAEYRLKNTNIRVWAIVLHLNLFRTRIKKIRRLV